MFPGKRNEDTRAASKARERAISVVKGGAVKGTYRSLKECSLDMGIPTSRICEYAKSGMIYKGGYEFIYL